MNARGSKALAAIVAGAVAVGIAGFTAPAAQALTACDVGQSVGTRSAGSNFNVVPPHVSSGLSLDGEVYGVQGNFHASMGSSWDRPDIVTSDSGPSTVTVDATTVSGVAFGRQTYFATATATSAHADAVIDTVVGLAGADYTMDPSGPRSAINADGSTLAASITAALPDVEAALSAGPAAQAFVAALQSAVDAAPTAGDRIMDGPAFTLENLTVAHDANLTGATSTVSSPRVTLGGGVAVATGYAATGTFDLVDGQGVNGRTTLAPVTWTLLGLPLLVPADGSAISVDTSSLPVDEQAGVKSSLGVVVDNILQLNTDAGLDFSVANVGFNVGEAYTPNLSGWLGDLPDSSGQRATGTHLLNLGGGYVRAECLDAPGVGDPNPPVTVIEDPLPPVTVIEDPLPPVTAAPHHPAPIKTHTKVAG